MSNEYFSPNATPAPNSPGSSAIMRFEFSEIAAAFDLLPVMAGNENSFVTVNATGTGLVANSGFGTETLVRKTASTGSAALPAGTTAERDAAPELGYLRFNTLTNSLETYYTGGWGAIAGVQGAQGPAGASGSQGVAGPTGAQGVQGVQGAPGEDAATTVIIGIFGASKVPANLPTNGLIPQDWDAVGVPAVATQLVVGDAMYYSVTGDLYVFVTTGTDPSGWVNIGAVTGPAGATGLQGVQGPQGLQGIQGVTGSTGVAGPAGAQGPIGATGPAGLVWTGAFNIGTFYVANQAFVYNGSSYICLTSVTGTLPPAAQYSVLAQAGADGAQGPTGATGAQGAQGIQGPAGPANPLSDTVPLIDGTPIAGVATSASRGDHVHPTDTSRASAASLSTLDGEAVKKTAATGAVITPAGTTAQRPAGVAGYFRYNNDLNVFEGYSNGFWGQVGGGQMYGTAAVKGIFYNAQSIAENVTVATGQNGMSAGPISVADGFTVTIADGSTWSVV